MAKDIISIESSHKESSSHKRPLSGGATRVEIETKTVTVTKNIN